MRILGIDPALAVTGYGLIETGSTDKITLVEAGVIRTSPGSGIAKRLAKIYCCLEDLLRESVPDVLVLEKLYSHYKHPTTSILMGHARGVICLLCGLKKIRLVNYAATRIKKAVTGNGHASKYQVQRVVTDVLRFSKAPEPLDVTDALALALGFVYIEMRESKLNDPLYVQSNSNAGQIVSIKD